ncbi:MAG: virulence RhuM family protein [Legionellaceae bacterium]|nr:virulence RhuM family protein [Legionellaceae bacterium]
MTDVDYNKYPNNARCFRKTTKWLHYAIHGRTTTELVTERADSNKLYRGLSNRKNITLV